MVALGLGEDVRRSSDASRASKESKQSNISFDSDGSLPSFFKAQTTGTSQWKDFLQDSESSVSANRFARVWTLCLQSGLAAGHCEGVRPLSNTFQTQPC